MPKPNDPYSRPINATRPEGQMLQGEFYGQHASDKALHNATGGRQVHQVRAMQSVVPVWPENAEPPKPKRGRPPGSKNRVKTTIDDIVPLHELEDDFDPTLNQEPTSPNTDATSPSEPATGDTQPPSVTEDDLFG